jgi:hypothetical protein
MGTGDRKNVPFLKREKIEEDAAKLLRKHGYEAIPVDLIGLAEQMDLDIENAEFVNDRIAGMITKKDGQVTTRLPYCRRPATRSSPSKRT